MAQRILVTGISGFIAKHVAFQLLQKGYEVRGTIRALNKAEQVRRSLLGAGADIAGLTFASADLTKNDGWEDAAKDCSGVMHIASPFPIAQPRNRNALTPAARDGALRVLRAAKNATRIIMTSSMAAMMYRPNRPPVMTVTEDDWTDVHWSALSAYVVSKTEAEKAAWDTATQEGFRHRLATVNPGLVLGPALDDDIGASLDVIRLFLKGSYPAMPPVSFPIVDVRDVAELHIRAFETPDAAGRRLIAAADTLSMQQIGAILRDAFPKRTRKIPARVLPAGLVRLLALFDRNLASVLPDLGTTPHGETGYVASLTGQTFRTAKEAVTEAGRSLERIKAL